jgi:succinate-semialdehyde dehydrogenase/glutarate-semialdehyde dehydrogenase
MAVMKEETFGPIVPFMRVAEASSALDLANDSELGLSAYVFTASRERAEWFAARLAAGSVVINDVVTHRATPEAPFGGVKRSGHGRVLGDEGLLAFCHLQHVSRPRVPSLPRDPFWFPYDETSLRVLSALLELVGTGKNPLVRGWRALQAAFAKPAP